MANQPWRHVKADHIYHIFKTSKDMFLHTFYGNVSYPEMRLCTYFLINVSPSIITDIINTTTIFKAWQNVRAKIVIKIVSRFVNFYATPWQHGLSTYYNFINAKISVWINCLVYFVPKSTVSPWVSPVVVMLCEHYLHYCAGTISQPASRLYH